jgi:hypothetical protein
MYEQALRWALDGPEHLKMSGFLFFFEDRPGGS